MRISRIFPVVLLGVLIPGYFSTLSYVSLTNKRLPKGEEVNVVLPSPVLKITSLEYDGLASDVLYLKSLVFYGSTWVGKSQRNVKEWEYDWLYNVLKASTDLDPYFLDPYFLANGVLGWEAKRVAETNRFLAKGSRYRDWDYWLPFFLGFNYYYFLGENDKAAEYLMKASKKPGADPFYGYFAARLAYKGNRTENAIIFLEGMLKTTKEKTIRKDYETRLEALKAILYLEKGEVVYKDKFGKNPDNLNALIEHRIISQIPVDPYGGEFYIDKDGSVKTTSDLRPMKKTKNN
ncbi:tetratricopeptide repeat protein [Geotalea uraniireducens]|uniref:Tetratricopeptide repeat protein n=1 Tax=Geotalea uraniireducens (strain Rf4) TaxID=351605 RepID=A5G4X9_GEOUR|nr:hypothetical protein [Geotalea uraniireducens]ABQ26847.1 hypothetical protein Gura_2673 [Geotalea uraniireducens Rf4]